MKIKVDFDLCESNALCEALAPQNFEIDDDDFLQILDENVTDENRDAVQQAIAACPKSAISLVEG
ncbi:ferredoxin [Nocardioides marmorisolisilvae]|uniref:Ferredoxin n=1 Tax=Nocardioides marmorisolisilvae TaxID=1542737 RepID=A0A3N0DV99_9ACTN|nr:ferredoxin [Nocardioides marmorisolisilvae]RNL79544.1 ferredoxin [Nocardioides marmorisolisilvae]